MSSHLEELPLFPLNLVLFPYAEMQIRVFESRYREMVNFCMQCDTGFGVVLIKSGQEVGEPAEPYLVGTAVRIVSVQTFDDGQMDVVIKGERRFRIRKLDQSRPYLVGYVEPLIEMELEPSPRADALLMKTRESFQTYMENYFSRFEMRVVKTNLPEDATALSFAVAHTLHIENLEKQHLLETTDTLERISAMLPILQAHIEATAPPRYQKLTSEELSEWITNN
ncbi:MAG: LON peptidase substrate-binding domain-containing protein [Fimbriimonadaceae bacterium]|jgi:Lon protease-like protein|nr:LON peptidase substrate-binding domain-containing protein [Fimbriimonadaceae bacterium]